ncbi:MAG: hypothetical protein KDH09_00890, partial [Chrysiogenetes bacterium]|nr:hypothetical protein [Chrysiogenetes bacterium]
ASFAFEPHWNPARTMIAFTRINVATKAQRMLSLYDVEQDKVIDVATMKPEDWTGYGFSPTWSPHGDALAFKVRNSDEGAAVYVVSVKHGKATRILPDVAGEIGELYWNEKGLFFSVREGGPKGPARRLRWVELPPVSDLVTIDPLALARQSVDVGEGSEPRYYDGSLYYLRSSKDHSQQFDLVRDELVGAEPEIVLSGVGPYFEIGPDGTIAYQSDPTGGSRPVRLTILRPGQSKGEVTRVSAFRFRFSPDGKRLACLWLVGGRPGYFVYDHRSKEIWALSAFRGDFTADALASLVNRPLFDW